MNTNKKVIATFTNRFGEEKKIRATRHGLQVQREEETKCQIIGKCVASHIGKRIKQMRESKNMTMQDLAIRAGLTTGSNHKQRVWSIENNLNGNGVRLGTLYQIALALECEVFSLLPTVSDIETETGATLEQSRVLSMK